MKPNKAEAADAVVRPMRIALTGGIASGKSAVERILRDEGIAVLDTDTVAHRCLRRGHPACDQILQEFGDAAVLRDGALDRELLGERVFGDEELRHRLNRIVHPYVKQDVETWLVEQAAAGRHAVVAVPLLFEAGMAEGWDAIVCVTADADTVRQRLSRRGLNDAEAQARMDAQMPQEEKMRRSDRYLENNGTLEELKQNVLQIWREITQKEQDYE